MTWERYTVAPKAGPQRGNGVGQQGYDYGARRKPFSKLAGNLEANPCPPSGPRAAAVY